MDGGLLSIGRGLLPAGSRASKVLVWRGGDTHLGRLKQLTPDELAEMEALNPRSPKEVEEEEAGEDPKASTGQDSQALNGEEALHAQGNRAMTGVGLALAALTGQAFAHEGHEHKIMGRVVAIDEKIEVEALTARRVTGVLSAETKYLRDKSAAGRRT
jgi:hypothetical protein